MAPAASAIADAELRVVRSRGQLREGVHKLRSRLTRPGTLAVAAALGGLLGFVLTRRGRMAAVAGAVAMALIRHGAAHLARQRMARQVK